MIIPVILENMPKLFGFIYISAALSNTSLFVLM
jgi:hypothetical protein